MSAQGSGSASSGTLKAEAIDTLRRAREPVRVLVRRPPFSWLIPIVSKVFLGRNARHEVRQVRRNLENIVTRAEARLSVKPKDFDAALGAAEAHYMLGNWVRATEACHKAIQIRPEHAAAYSTLFKVLKARAHPGRLRRFVIDTARNAPDVGVAKATDFGRLQEKAIARGLPSIQLATFDRSASTTVARTLETSLGLPLIRIVFHEIPAATNDERRRIVPEVYEVFARGGALAKEHLRPIPENFDVMRRYGQTKVVVHIRDPRQHLVSHCRAGEARSDTESWSLTHETLSDKIDATIDGHFRLWMWWLREWLTASREFGGDFDVLFTSFEEFKADPQALYAKILDFYGIDQAKWRAANDAKVTRNFRKGEPDEWREVLTSEQKDRCWNLMPEDIRGRFGWHP